MSDTLLVIYRAAIAFTTLLIFTRILGKQQVSQLTFFDYIIGITVGSIAADIIDTQRSLYLQILGLAAWMGFALLLQVATLKSRLLSKLFDGKPTIVVRGGKILEKNMAKIRYRQRDLLEQLRQKDAFTLADVEFAVIETNGSLSVLKKSQHQPVTPHDLAIPTAYEGFSTELIFEGKLSWKNLLSVNRDYQWLIEQLNKQGIRDINEVFFASLDTQGNLYVDSYRDQGQKQLPGINS